MRAARVAAQAKINLFLRVVTGPDPTGYHSLHTLFQRIDLADDVVVRVDVGERALTVRGPRLPAAGLGPAEENLAWRAAMEYAAHNAWAFPKDFRIEVTKNIPVGGGLGGGSADAGAVLRALDALAPKPMDPEALRSVAASLGADVPFLASGFVRAMGMGRGDAIADFDQPMFPVPQAHVLLVVPKFAIATVDAYRWLDESRPSPWPPTSGGPQEGALPPVSSPWEGLCISGNDFEPVVERRFPLLREIRERLIAKGAAAARLSGSGSSVFGLFEGTAPSAIDLALDADIIHTLTSERVVPVEVLE